MYMYDSGQIQGIKLTDFSQLSTRSVTLYIQ